MTTQVTSDPEVGAYARQVREALADVPAARLEELLEDLEEHLVEVAAETPGPLTDRLGSPADYAAELRRAAGLPEAEVTDATQSGRRWSPAALHERYGDHPAVVSAREFAPELRPAWWVVRGWAAVAAIGVVFTGDGASLLPTLGLGVVGWFLTAAAVVLSVRQGLRDRAAARPLTHLAAFVNLALGVCLLIALAGLASRSAPVEYTQQVSYDSFPTTLTHEDGTPITNIVPIGPDGEALDGVLLYDQDGRPIDNLSTYTSDGGEVTRQESGTPAPANSFPQRQDVVTYDEFGSPVTSEFPVPTPGPAAPASAEPTVSAPAVTAAPTP